MCVRVCVRVCVHIESAYDKEKNIYIIMMRECLVIEMDRDKGERQREVNSAWRIWLMIHYTMHVPQEQGFRTQRQ